MKRGKSQKEVGYQVAELRKIKGLSQEELAKKIKISRSSLAQIELGNRSLDVLELQNLSYVLEFSLDDFMSDDFLPSKALEVQAEKKAKKQEERISVPTLNIDKFKNVLLYILEKCAGRPNVGETVLYKLLYFADFNYYELYEEHLTGAKYRKLPYGPVPQGLEGIIQEMMEAQQLQRVKTTHFGYTQTRYLPLETADLRQLKASETELIDRVIDQIGHFGAKQISDYSHKDMPWAATDDGDLISYNLAFYRESPYSVRVYNENENE